MFLAIASRLEGLRRRYAEPHRRYHDQSHIDAMLLGLRAAGSAVADPAMVELAIWYHDGIYDPASTDNEARSAALLRADLSGLAAEPLVAAAADLIEATADHRLPAAIDDARRGDAAIFLDLDMAILGAGPQQYDAYEAGIAQEYAPVHGLAAFRRGRLAFLQGLLTRDRWFLTERFNRALAGPARTNVRRAIYALGGTATP